MATFTASIRAGNVARSVHTGVIAAHGRVTISATGTAASKVLLVRLPDGAVVLDYLLYSSTTAAADQTIELGFSATPSALLAVHSLSASGSQEVSLLSIDGTRGQQSLLLPYRLSMSDSAQPHWDWVIATYGAAISASALVSLTLFYTMENV
jgi:hypothetical protein|tara:strand:+ start:934 stop:1389 length:456 start_codon:yes stop_codon:yes gene_type:complete